MLLKRPLVKYFANIMKNIIVYMFFLFFFMFFFALLKPKLFKAIYKVKLFFIFHRIGTEFI